MAFQASKYFEAIVIGAQFLWGWQLIQNCFFSLLIFSLSIFGHTSLHLHISEVCGLRNYKERAIIIPALVWAQELHTDLLPCGVCFSPQFKRFGMPCWCQQLLCLLHLSVFCSQGIPVAGPTEQAAGPSRCSPGSCWKGLAQGRRGTSTNRLMKM